MSELVESLNAAQRQAVEHGDGPLLLLAGPGSGKTRVIVHRVARLLDAGIPPRRIVALTFTNKAADEMRARLARLAPEQPVWMGTFHRFCSRLLRQHASLIGLEENFTIYDAADSRAVLRRVLDELQLDTALYSPERLLAAISWAKNHLIAAREYQPRSGQPLGHVVSKVYPAYQARLEASNAVDFDDLLLHTALLLRDNTEIRATLDDRYRYILVDEYQDTNSAQYTIIRGLSIDYPNLTVTGDPDQSIYGWRGANLNNILDFERDFQTVKVIKLEQNYRSTQRILAVADALIAYNQRRKAKSLFTENDEGTPVGLVCFDTQRSEAESIAATIATAIHDGQRRPRDFAIFYRVNALSRSLEQALGDEGIPYQIIHGLEFYQRREIKDVLAYLQLINNPRDDNALLRVFNVPPRGIGKGTIGKLTAHASLRGLSLAEAARESGLIESLPKRAAVAVAKFVAILDRLSLIAAAPVEEVMGHVLAESGYQQFLTDSEDEEDQERLANIEELLTAAREFDERHGTDNPLEAFLEESSLVNDTDTWEENDDRVTLMTLHASKGLEFPVVFIVALEEGLLPHERCREHVELLEEERRLFFVGITRACEQLQLSLANYREFRGRGRRSVPSQFLMELPRAEMRLVQAPSAEVAAEVNIVEQELHDYPPEWDEVFDEVDSEMAEPVAKPTAGMAPTMLSTAAELERREARPVVRAAPDSFYQGMLVRHPEYGLGKVVALGGSGVKRTATVAFASSAGQRKFMLAQSPLVPAKSE